MEIIFVAIWVITCIYMVTGAIVLTVNDIPPPIIGVSPIKIFVSIILTVVAFTLWPIWVQIWRYHDKS